MGCLFLCSNDLISYFLNFFLPNTATPISPEPNMSSVAGSGTGEADGAPTGSEFEIVTVVVTKRLESLKLLLLSSLHPKAPKIINPTHKTTNNFFILISPIPELFTPKIWTNLFSNLSDTFCKENAKRRIKSLFFFDRIIYLNINGFCRKLTGFPVVIQLKRCCFLCKLCYNFTKIV